MTETEKRAPRIGLLCLSAIADDPRVRRQGDLFRSRGWEVAAFGLPGAKSDPPPWACSAVPGGLGDGSAPENSPAFLTSTARRLRRLVETVLIQGAGRRPDPLFWRLNPAFRLLFEAARAYPADIWLANDWTTILIAQRLAQEQGVPYAYDTHEFAVDEYAHRLRWRLLQRPVVAAVERQGIAGAAVVSCPSEGIARRLQELYRLPEQPLLVRNMPVYEEHAFRACGETVEVLYHGVVSPGRALEEAIRSVVLWRPEFRLTIRGPASQAYRQTLSELARSCGVADRIVFAPPVPMIDLVREAARFDVGLFCLKGTSTQNTYVLPNKFFEYAMAGLALVVSDLPEMSKLVRRYDLGGLVPAVTPKAIAETVNGLQRSDIERYKQNALGAAKELNWEIDAERLFRAIAATVRSRPAGRPPSAGE